MKKVLFMLTSMNIGGVEKSLLSLLDCMPKEEYEVTLLLLNKSGGFLNHVPAHIKIEEAIWYKDVKHIIMDSPYKIINRYKENNHYLKIIRFIYYYFFDKYFDNRFNYYKYAMKNIANHRDEYDVAISYQGPTDIIDYYIAYKVKAKEKISWVHFDVSEHSFNPKLYKKLYNKYNKIFVVSNEGKNKLISKINNIREKTKVFPNIISKDMIISMSKEDISFDNNYKGIKIVTVGRLSREKGQDIAIEVLNMLRNNGFDARWYCVGDGNDRDYYEKLIKGYKLQNDFILIGATPNPYPYIKNADIYVQPSRHEGYCLTLAEAICLEKKIVTTNFIGAYEQIKDEVDGIICECNIKSLYENIKRLLD